LEHGRCNFHTVLGREVILDAHVARGLA